MALPPIISNLPFLKLFKADSAARGAGKPDSAVGTKPANNLRDVVQISEAAAKKLSGDDIRSLINQTRDLLKQNDGATLGLDPAFS